MLSKEKIDLLKKEGKDPRRNLFQRTHYISNLLKEDRSLIKIIGRIVSKRHIGKISFINLKDKTGEIQVFTSKKILDDYALISKCWELGDMIGVEGYISNNFKKITVQAHKISIIAKTLVAFSRKVTNPETLYRQRYLDLMINNSSERFIKRSKIISSIRSYLNQKEYIECETPMLHYTPTGAIAKPFKTHHFALKQDMYLRIAPELYLKKLIVGGLEKVYEINKSFRNEGISLKHNPEFTMLELYQANCDFNQGVKLAVDILQYCCSKACKSMIIEYQNNFLDFNCFNTITMQQAVKQFTNINQNILPDDCLAIFEEKVEKQLIQPTVITHYPAAASPLAMPNMHNSKIADRFEIFIGGMEVANGYLELNDPQIQEENMIKQGIVDQDFITALRYGMPVTMGLGIGIDRLCMLLTNSSNIRDVILFPTLKKLKQ